MSTSRHYGEVNGKPGVIQPMRDSERVIAQIRRGEALAGPEAARRIARRITEQGGFWGPRRTTA